MRKVIINIVILVLACLLLQAYAQAQPDERLFEEAKVLIFDKEWKEGQEKLEELLDKYPDSPWYSQAVFYRAKCLEERKGKELDALKAYKDYIRRRDRRKSLTEDSELSIIDLAFELYKDRKRTYLDEIEKRLSSSNRVVRYFAAIKLSQVKEKKVASRAVPVLKEIIKKEKDDELRDRAKIALLRVDPGVLKDLEEERPVRKAQLLKIRVWKDGELTLLRKEGYDLDTITKTLVDAGEVIYIENKEEGTIIKIWIE
jgi:hypothetical protein